MSINYSVIFTERQKAELIPSSFNEKPAPHEIIGKTLVSVISNGSETGEFLGYGDGEGLYTCETGYANILQIIETGSEVKNLHQGDLVFSLTPHKLYNKVSEKMFSCSERDSFEKSGALPFSGGFHDCYSAQQH